MAIQHRRGSFNRFDPTRLLPGEWAVVLDGDEHAGDGKGVYICFAAGDVKRMATFEDMVENIAGADEEIVAQLTASARAVEAAIEQAEAQRAGAEEGRADAEDERAAAESARVSAESGRVSAESSRVSAEAQRVADFAIMEQRSKGWLRHYCSEDEFDPETRRPTVGDPNDATLYYVPSENPTTDNMWVEWQYDTDKGRWELQGTTESTIDPVTTAQIDDIADDETVTGTQVLNATGLTYLWTKLKAAFAAIAHTHSASDIATGAVPVANGGTGADSADDARANLGAAAASHTHEASDIASGQLAIANGGTGASTAAAAASAIVDGNAIAPSSVAATGAVSGSSVSDSVGSLADLRDSVSRLSAPYVTDLNNVIPNTDSDTSSISFARYRNTASNRPLDTWGVCIQVAHGQLAFGGNSLKVYTRRNNNGAWSDWQEV